MPVALIRVATPDYFRTMRIPVLQGREFSDSDDANPTPGFVVNQAFVDAYLKDGDPLRAQLRVVMEANQSLSLRNRRRRRT